MTDDVDIRSNEWEIHRQEVGNNPPRGQGWEPFAATRGGDPLLAEVWWRRRITSAARETSGTPGEGE